MNKNTAEMFVRIFKTLEPPPDLKLSEWADKYRQLSSEASAEPGRWKTAKAPYQKEIMDAITDISIKKVVVMSAAQVGKTDAMILNPIGYYIHYEPSPIMVLQPTIQMAEAFSKDRLSPMLRDTTVLTERVNDKSRNSGNTILQKIFPGGHVTMVGANSPSSLASRPIRVLLADEIDRYPATAGSEGDPLFLAAKRLTTFWNRKEVDVSTPTIKGLSRIEVEYENSSRGEWNTPCPCCGELQPLTWSGIVFEKDDLSEIKYACCKCGVISSEVEWKERFIDGCFVHEDPENPVRGFHLNTLASTLATWREVVEKFLIANEEKKKGNIELMKVWTNTELGETWEEEGEQLEDEDLMKRREKYNCEVPDDVLYLTAGVDTQDDRFEIEVVGWGPEYESWGIRYAAIYGDNSDINNQVWKDLDAFLQQTWEKPDGTKLKIACTCIDSGGHRTNQVYKFCKSRFARRVFAIKGSNDSAAAYIQKPTKSNREGTYLFTIGVDTGKSWLMDRLKVEEEGPGYCHFPKEDGKGYDEKYFKGLTSEKKVLRYKMGRPYFAWELKDKGEHKRNEALDCRNYATAAIEIINVPLKKPKTKNETAPQVTKKPAKRGRRRSGGII
ncbi:MAG: phage terminase large subunit family protein [Phascolarctobacterium sp.]|nr:phage terminase large subunit family protein [Candidatus Phascolarctobacterium caballi]